MSHICYFWDEVEDNVIEASSNGTTVGDYTHEPIRYGAILSQVSIGEVRHYHFDAVGNTTELTDGHCNLTDVRRYSAFGPVTETVSSTSSFPFQFGGAFGYSSSDVLSPLYIRARLYNVGLGRWLSLDPAFSDLSDLYQYSHNNPIVNYDPGGDITIQPAEGARGTASLGRIECGKVAHIKWDFLRERHGEKGEGSCEGYFVQKVTVACAVNPCKTLVKPKAQSKTDICSIDLDQLLVYEYWEAWHVKKGKPSSDDRQDQTSGNDRCTDQARQKAQDLHCGYYNQTGEVRFYCLKATGNLRNSADWHNPTKQGRIFYPDPKTIYSKDEQINNYLFSMIPHCRTSPMDLVSTDKEPAFWSKASVEGPAYRNFNLHWFCCPHCPTKDRFGVATASPAPSK